MKHLQSLKSYEEFLARRIPEMCVPCDEVRDMFEDRLINLSDEQIKSTWIDYYKIAKGYTMDNPITQIHLVDEGIVRSYDIDTTIKHIKNYFELPDEFIKKLSKNGGDEQIYINIPIVGDNFRLLKKAMNYCGYYLGRPSEKDLEQNTYQWLQFEKLIQTDNTQQIKNEEDILYHITPKYNVGKIKHIGFSPRDKHELYNYPERVYFLRGSTNKNTIKDLIQDLFDNNHSKGNKGQYVIMTIDIDKIPIRVHFFVDANCEGGVFTRDNVPPETITDIKDIIIENGKVQGWD